MQRLQQVNPESATGKAKELLSAIQKKMGKVPNILKVMANSPAALEAYFSFSGAMASGILPATLREQIALIVADTNNCNYCLAAHGLMAQKAGLSEIDIQNSCKGISSDKKTEAILQFTRLIVEKRAEVKDEDVAKLRKVGLSDAEIVEIIALVSVNIFTNYFNHIVNTDIDFPQLIKK